MKHLRPFFAIFAALIGFGFLCYLVISAAQWLWPIIAQSFCTNEATQISSRCRSVGVWTALAAFFVIALLGPLITVKLRSLVERESPFAFWTSLMIGTLPCFLVSLYLSVAFLDRLDEILLAWVPVLGSWASGLWMTNSIELAHRRSRREKKTIV